MGKIFDDAIRALDRFRLMVHHCLTSLVFLLLVVTHYKTWSCFFYPLESHNLGDTYIKDSHLYNAEKGSYAVDSAGNLTLTKTHYAYLDSFSMEGVTWFESDHPGTTQMGALIIGDHLYLGQTKLLFTAQGAVSGIVGTWTDEIIEKSWDADSEVYITEYKKAEIIFEANGSCTLKSYESDTEGYEYFGIIEVTYTYINETLSMTLEDNNGNDQTIAVKVKIHNNKYLILGDDTSYSAHAYFKQ